ncbi:MAG: hypothetical protein V1742_02625 [Pseudomonadota bacterium]
MAVELKEVKNRRELKKYIYLPKKIHAGHKTWVPPLYGDEWKYYNPKKNRAFSYCDSILFLAYRGRQAAGRIMGLINRRYNERHNLKTARFSYLETWEDPEAVQALLNQVEAWAKNKGMNRLVGPYAFTDQDPQGFLIEGFEHRATIVTIHNYPWMPRLVENAGYAKEVDYYVYQLEVPKEIPEIYKKAYERVLKRSDFEVLKFRKKSEVKPWIRPALQIMNETFLEGGIYGYTLLDEQEMEDLAGRFRLILDPRLLILVKKDDEPVSFFIGLPDMSEGLQKAGGRLFPFGWYKILRAMKKTKQLDLLLGGIKGQYRGRGLDVLMAMTMIQAAHELGLETVDTHSELESNVKMRSLMEKLGGKVYKRFRVYFKDL